MSGMKWFKLQATLSDHNTGDLLIKRNYRQAKRQKEEARKTRQLQKQQRRSERTTTGDATVVVEPSAPDGNPLTPPPSP